MTKANVPSLPQLSLIHGNSVYIVETTIPAPNATFYYSVLLGAFSKKELAVAEVNKICIGGNSLYATFSIKKVPIDTGGQCVIVASYDRVKWRIFDVSS